MEVCYQSSCSHKSGILALMNGQTAECAMADHGIRAKRVSQNIVKTQPVICVERP